MYYYKKEGINIIKYQIRLNEEILKKLKTEIILNCSTITHHHYKTTNTPNYFDWEHIQNYKQKKVGVIEYNDFYSQPEDEYLVDYDYLEHPPLVGYIDDLLKGNTSVIEKIEKMKDEILDKERIILVEQQTIIQKLSNTNNKNKQQLIDLLNESQKKLLEYYKEKELNKNQVPVSKYKNKILDCILMEEVEKIPLKNVLEVVNFLYESNNKTIENNLNKVLKLKL